MKMLEVCEICGRELEGKQQKYCSNSCKSNAHYRRNKEEICIKRAKYRREHREEYNQRFKDWLEHNPDYLTKKRMEKYHSSPEERKRCSIRAKDRYKDKKLGLPKIGKCVECGRVKKLENHHFDYDKEGNKIRICKECHGKERRIYADDIYTSLPTGVEANSVLAGGVLANPPQS